MEQERCVILTQQYQCVCLLMVWVEVVDAFSTAATPPSHAVGPKRSTFFGLQDIFRSPVSFVLVWLEEPGAVT